MKIWERKLKTGTTYYAHFSVNGQRKRIKLDALNKTQAKEMAAEIQYKMLSGQYDVLKKQKKHRLREVADQYIEFVKANKRSWDRDVLSLKNILRMEIDGKKLGDRNIDEIKVKDVQKYQIRRKRELDEKFDQKGIPEKERNYASVNREMACLKHLFYLAIEWELCLKNPVVSKSIKFDKEKERKRTLTDEEYQLLLQGASGHLKIIVIIALNTGMRRGEILRLSWDDIDMVGRKIKVTMTKNDEDREVPINAYLFDVLDSIPNKTGYLFPNRAGKPIGSIKTTWNKTKERLGITDLRFHDLRHTAATRMAKAKVTESVIALILGHKRGSITSRYINPHWEEMVEAVEALGEVCHIFVTSDYSTGKGRGNNVMFSNKIKEVG